MGRKLTALYALGGGATVWNSVVSGGLMTAAADALILVAVYAIARIFAGLLRGEHIREDDTEGGEA